MQQRPRILRTNGAIREMVQETQLSPSDFIVPIFIEDGNDIRQEIPSLPGYYRFSLDKAIEEAKLISRLGIKSILLFVKCPDELKDNEGEEALNPEGLMQRSVKVIKEACPELYLMTDVALDPFSSFGHDGVVKDDIILNDETNKILAKMAVSHAQAGADMVAPSDMMDGRVESIRQALEKNGFHRTGIMSYSAKYASCFYGPFRDALDSAPGFGDKKSYQMNPANRTEALKEAELDEVEGADIIMIKPAISYLDIIREIKNSVRVPVSAYHVSGEYSMIKAAAEKGWLNEQEAMLETTLSIKRAGADLIATYFAKDLAKVLNEG